MHLITYLAGSHPIHATKYKKEKEKKGKEKEKVTYILFQETTGRQILIISTESDWEGINLCFTIND